MKKTNIIIKTQFEAIHCWPGAPRGDTYFLRHPHRHIFYVIMKWEVNHNDRDKEFFKQKWEVMNFIQKCWHGEQLGGTSCEMIAEELMNRFNANYVSVFEDNENGAEVYHV